METIPYPYPCYFLKVTFKNCLIFRLFCPSTVIASISEAYLELCQIYKTEGFFVEIVNSFYTVTRSQESSIIFVWKGSKDTSVYAPCQDPESNRKYKVSIYLKRHLLVKGDCCRQDFFLFRSQDMLCWFKINIWKSQLSWIYFIYLYIPFGTNPTKWSNTLKQFVGNLSVFDLFVGLALKWLKFVNNILNIKMYQTEVCRILQN